MQVGGFLFLALLVSNSEYRATQQRPDSMRLIEPKRYAGIDYDFRPESFWAPVSDLEAILRNIKGRAGVGK
jgi:hypothetical protein